MNKLGVYTATCSHTLDDDKQCGGVYTGQSTHNTLRIRLKGHLKSIEKIEHNFYFKLIKSESNVNRFDILESLHIYLNHKNIVGILLFVLIRFSLFFKMYLFLIKKSTNKSTNQWIYKA